MIDYKKLIIENAKLKDKLIKLTHDYNNLLERAKESNKQVTEYRALAQSLVTKLTEQLNITETYVLGTSKRINKM